MKRAYSRLSALLIVLLGLFAAQGCGALTTTQPTLAALFTVPPGTSVPSRSPLQPVTSTQAASETTPVRKVKEVATPVVLASPTAVPHTSARQAQPDVEASWLLAYDSDAKGNDEIYVLPAGGGPPVNVTHHPAEDRRPSWSPDGHQIAFQTNRDGNWELYTLDLRDGDLRRLTFNISYDGAPFWSPDGTWIVFESYRDAEPCPNATPAPGPGLCLDLEIYRVPVTGGSPQRLTTSSGGDYEPAVSPDGTRIAFTSWRTGDKEIFVMPANGGEAHNVTASAGDDWAPAWLPDGVSLVFLSERTGVVDLFVQHQMSGPARRLTESDLPEERPTSWADGRLLYARYDPGPRFEADDPFRPGAYHLYSQADVSQEPVALMPTVPVHRPAAAPLAAPSNARFSLAPPEPKGLARKLDLIRVTEVAAPDPRLVEEVDEALGAWRSAVYTKSGYDFLGRLSDVFRPAGYYSHRLGYLSWHKAGRAVDLLFDWRGNDGRKALYIVREDLAGQVYWRLYLKCAVQDGSLGEPLTRAPWHFWWHADPAKTERTVADGGRRLSIPSGYFLDITALAERYGWSRIASYQLDDFHWKRDSTATEYWHYQHTDQLTWYESMAQIYPREWLEQLFSRTVAAARGQSEEVMDGKGLPPMDSTTDGDERLPRATEQALRAPQ